VSYCYQIKPAGSKTKTSNWRIVIDDFKTAQLTFKQHYSLARISPGYTLAANTDLCLFEIGAYCLNQLSALEIIICYEDALFREYQRVVQCWGGSQ